MADLDDLFDRAPDPRGDGTVTVTQLNEYIKAKIDGDGFLSRVSVKGEISNFTNHYKTGHFYFTIKDETSLIRAVMFRGNTAAEFPHLSGTDSISCIAIPWSRTASVRSTLRLNS